MIKKTAPGHWERIETKTPGIPDVIYVTETGSQGFLELKRLKVWPSGKSSFGLSREQALFLYRWSSHGGKASAFFSIENTFHLLSGGKALNLIPGITKEEFLDLVSYTGELNWPLLRTLL